MIGVGVVLARLIPRLTLSKVWPGEQFIGLTLFQPCFSFAIYLETPCMNFLLVLNKSCLLMVFCQLGTPVCTNIDEFLEKFQTAFDPPLPPLFWEKCRDFFLRNFLERK